jgi:uncharacterized membrane protein YagU involved in acid resistance
MLGCLLVSLTKERRLIITFFVFLFVFVIIYCLLSRVLLSL